jgi:hypothetical protein
VTVRRIKATLPISEHPLGAWLDAHGGELSVTCQLGQWCVRVSWCELVSYSDEHGAHRKTWEVVRYAPDFGEALKAVLDEVAAQTGGV